MQGRISRAVRNIASKSLYRSICHGEPRLVALAILAFWYQDRMGGLLEELGEPEKEMTRKAKGSQGNRGAKSEIFCCKCNYTIHIPIQDLPEKQQKSVLKQPIVNLAGWY